MNQDLFNNLPSEIILDVLSRLPFRSIARCKCVCKPWLRLLQTNEFVKIHLSKSVPGLLVLGHRLLSYSYSYLYFDLEDGSNIDIKANKPVARFKLPNCGSIYGSSDGLLFYHENTLKAPQLYICNPVTRDYIELRYPYELGCSPSRAAYGFGKSGITGQHKVVRISQGDVGSIRSLTKSECKVYTLETGSWRTIAPGPTFCYTDQPPVFVNGNLHWVVFDSNDIAWISCFNLETETFTTFSAPILSGGYDFDVYYYGTYLCLHADTLYYGIHFESFIWVMKDYGAANSWTKEFIDISRRPSHMNAFLHTPSFLSLKCFVREKVCSF